MGAAREQVERGLKLWNDGELAELHSEWAPDGVMRTPLGTFTGSDAILDYYRRDLLAFPDRRTDAPKWVEEGDTVVLEGEFTGTHSGPLEFPDGSTVPPTGQQLRFPVVIVFEMSGGKTVAQRSYWDHLQVLTQLGLLAPTQQP